MMTNTRPLRTTRLHRSIRLRPIVDLLEGRIVLSTMTDFGLETDPSLSLYMVMPSRETLNAVSVDPPSGSTMRRTPEWLSVTFDRPFDPDSTFHDLRLAVRQDDGTWAPFGDEGLPVEMKHDDTSTILSATFGALGNGEYRLYLSGDSLLTGKDGTFLSIDSQDFVLSEFSIGAAGIGLEDATDLGPIVSSIRTVDGSLDFASNPTDVRLYKIELTEGHFWRLGLEASTGSGRGGLGVGITLFDADGRTVSSATTGRPSSPSNPYLFQGLASGTYYIGVSSRSNMPGSDGGYNPATGEPGVPTPHQAGGQFRLELVADPADAPTSVKTLFLNYADPNSAIPSGLTIQFSGAISARSMTGHTDNGVIVRDRNGRTWPVRLAQYSETSSSLSFLFDQPLPRGEYTVLAAEGGLTDLAGLQPTAPGKAEGTLGTFRIEKTPDVLLQKDFGTLLPGGADDGVFRSLGLGQGSTTDVRLVLTVSGLYWFELSSYGSLSSATLKGENGQSYNIDLSPTGAKVKTLLDLEPGVYHLSLVTPPGRGAVVDASIRFTITASDSLLDNGVGSGPGLGLRLLAPATLTPSPTPHDAPDVGSTPNIPTPGPTPEDLGNPGSVDDSPGDPIHNPGPPSLSPSGPGFGSLYFAAATSTTLGSPSNGSMSLGAVGPSANGTSAAIASNEAGLPKGLAVGIGESLDRVGGLSEETPSESDEVGTNVVDASNGQLVELAASDSDRIDAALEGLIRDGAVVEKAMEIQPLAIVFKGKWADQGSPTTAVDAAAGPENAEVIAEGEPAEESEDHPIETADVSSSLGVGLLAVAAAHYQRQVGKWVSKVRQRYGPALRIHGGNTGPRGPHRQPRG